MIIKSQFESQVTKRDIYKIKDFTDLGSLDKELKKCRSHIIAKVDSGKADVIRFLMERGFSYSIASASLECNIDDLPDKAGACLGNINSKDLRGLYRICDESFASGNRYANDAYLKKFNRQIHRQWICNSITGYADYNCGYMSGAHLAGLGTLHIHKKYSSIGLLAVAGCYRRRRIASAIIERLKQESLSNGMKRVVVATELCNYAALNLYAKSGFSFYRSSVSVYRMAVNR